ncbi:MAG: hypothetical protein ACRET0_13310 [Steroidobacteraceae bacterium]
MSSVRAGQPGATRICPHCKAIVLESAAVCPGCRHHLRFNTTGKQAGAADVYCALNVDGTIAHRQTSEPCEYCIVLDITNERGEQLVRQVVGVGALQPGELRRLNLSVDMLPVGLPVAKAPAAAAGPSPTGSTGRPALGPPMSTTRPGVANPAPAAGSTPAGASAARPAAPGALPAAAPASKPAAASPTPPFAPARNPTVAPPTPVPARAPLAPTPAAKPASGAVPKALNPAPGGTLGQRLRIFRKP